MLVWVVGVLVWVVGVLVWSDGCVGVTDSEIACGHFSCILQ